MASIIFLPNGLNEYVTPSNGVHWTLKELQEMVGGYIEIVETVDGRWMVINEHGKVTRPSLPLNIVATRLYKHGRVDPIVGVALVVDNRLELDGPEDGKEDA